MNAENVGLTFLFLLLLAIASVACGIMAMAGASIAGMPESKWALEPLAYLFLGFVGGGILFSILSFSLRKRCGESLSASMGASFVVVLPMAFVGGMICYKFSVYDAKMNSEKYRVQTKEEVAQYKSYHQKIKEDPGIVLREGWYRNSGPDGFLKWRVYRDSFKNPYVPYTPVVISQLIGVERENPHIFQTILMHSQLDSQTLEREYRLALEEAKRNDEKAGWRLYKILSVPNAKKSWLEEVDLSGITAEHGVFWKDCLRKKIEGRLKPK